MAPHNPRGMVSLRTIGILVVILAVLALLLGPVRQWGLKSFDSNTQRRQEFDRRVRAQRHGQIQEDLARAGITVESEPEPTGPDSGAVGPSQPRRRVIDRIRIWWHRLWSAPPDPGKPSIPILRDSLGLLPGERAVLPDGRIVHYDTTTFRYQPPTGE